MQKRVLLAEAANAIRSVAEPALRQNGYEVIAVATAEKALQVLQLSRPDLIVVGSGLTVKSGRPLYEKLQGDRATSSLPILVMAPPDETDLPLPEEVIIRLPLEPKRFLEAVRQFSSTTAAKAPSENPLSRAEVKEDFLDAALGLDRIEVTESEVMDRTLRKRLVSGPAAMQESGGRSLTDSNSGEPVDDSQRVESIIVDGGQSDINAGDSKLGKPTTETAGLPILTDSEQYGLDNPDVLRTELPGATHDYDWFIRELGRDDERGGAGAGRPSVESKAPAPSAQESTEPPPVFSDTGNQKAAVARFIDEFRREVEQFESGEPETISVSELAESEEKKPAGSSWEDSLEELAPGHARVFTKQLARELADRIAEKIVAKLDPQKLMQLVAAELADRAARSRRP